MSKVLPQELVISGADSHVYRIGLSLFKPKYYVKRSLFYKPIIVFIISFLQLIRSFALLILPIYEDKFIYLYLGDIGYFIGFTREYNAIICLLELIVIISQFIHYYNYRNGIKPMDLRVFQMISGLISPKSIQINDKLLVYKLCKITKMSFKFMEYFKIIFSAWSFCFCIIIFSISIKISYIEITAIIIPNIMLWSIMFLYAFPAFGYQIIYYLIITYYLILKLKAINTKFDNKVKNFFFIWRQLNAIYVEIIEYNDIFWSKFLCLLWMTSSAYIALSIYANYSMYIHQFHFILRYFFTGCLIFYSLLFIFILHLTSDLYNQCFSIYKTLNSKQILLNRFQTRLKIKVSFCEIYILI